MAKIDSKAISAILLHYFLIIVFKNVIIISASKLVYGEPEYKCPERIKLIHPCTCIKESDDGIDIKCENVNLASLSVALANLGALEIPVERLFIYKGQFSRLYGPIFATTRARILYVEKTPLQAIEDYSFYGLNKTLEELYILQSNLTKITPLAFGILGKLNQLVIEGHNFKSFDKNLFVGQEISNKLEILRIVNGTLNDLPIETFQHLRKLKTLDLHSNDLETLKRNQFKNLRELEVLDLSFNKIKKFDAQHISDLTKLGWCNVSHNALTELSRGTFARNSVLKWLSMSHNKITRLDVNSFRGMRFLRRLYLNDNNISDIGRGTFGSLTRIGTIDLARNALKKVEYQMFSQLNYVEIINVAENNITIIEKNSFKDIYQATINISHNALEKVESNAFENCVNITTLDLSFNRLQNFSRNAFDLLTFATEFQLSYNYFTDLSHIPIHNMTGIKIVNASHNRIELIPKNAFPKLYELHTVDVSYNNLSNIWNGVFQTLFGLRSLNLSHNSLEELKSSVFGTLPTLLELDLSHNSLNNIARGALAKLTSLRTLDISHNSLDKIFQIPISLNELHMHHNRIGSIVKNTWPVMNSLIYLDLSYNELGDSLESDSFAGLLVVQKLFLQSNSLTQPPAQSLSSMTTLQYLYLNNNNITALEKSAFGKLPVLFEINLSNNGVHDISKRAFEGLLQLLTLNLSSNAIAHIPNDAFIGLPSLRRLDLSNNLLTKLDNRTNGVLDDLLSIEWLDLSHNKISFVTKKTFPEHQYIPYNLKYLNLSHNQMPVLTYDLTFGTKKLLALNVSNNRINEIRPGVLSNMTSLRSLDVSNNELTDLAAEANAFRLPNNLTKLYLQNNSLQRLPFDKLVKMIQFEEIDFRNNQLSEFPLNLVSQFRNGTRILFSGNALHCSCAVRPLKHYITELSDLSDDMHGIVCESPTFISGQYLEFVSDDNLQCNLEEREIYKGTDYEERSDVLFREIKINEKTGNYSAIWFIQTSKDIAGFNLYIRNSSNDIIYEKLFNYNERKAQISLSELGNDANKIRDTEICIVSTDSLGNTGRWYRRQCEKMPAFKQKRKCRICFSGANSKSFQSFNAHLVILTQIVLLFAFNRISYSL